MSATALIAVLGADSPVGELLIEALADAGHARRGVLAVNGADIDEPLPGQIAAACADGSVAGADERLRTLAAQGVPALGINGAGDPAWPVVLAADDRPQVSQLRLAPGAWVVLARLLRPLNAAFGIESVAATALQPASQRGAAALEILGQQTAAVLNFRDPPEGVYLQRIAFNTLPVAPDPALHAACAGALWPGAENDVQLQAWDVPVFVGLSMSLFLTLARSTPADELLACIAAVPGVVISGDDDEVPSPVTSITTENALIIRDVQVSGRRLQLAVIADNLGIGAAEPAAALLRRLSGCTA